MRCLKINRIRRKKLSSDGSRGRVYSHIVTSLFLDRFPSQSCEKSDPPRIHNQIRLIIFYIHPTLYHDGDNLNEEFLKNGNILASKYPINMNESAFERSSLGLSNAHRIIS